MLLTERKLELEARDGILGGRVTANGVNTIPGAFLVDVSSVSVIS